MQFDLSGPCLVGLLLVVPPVAAIVGLFGVGPSSHSLIFLIRTLDGLAHEYLRRLLKRVLLLADSSLLPGVLNLQFADPVHPKLHILQEIRPLEIHLLAKFPGGSLQPRGVGRKDGQIDILILIVSLRDLVFDLNWTHMYLPLLQKILQLAQGHVVSDIDLEGGVLDYSDLSALHPHQTALLQGLR